MEPDQPKSPERWGWIGAIAVVLTVLIGFGALYQASKLGSPENGPYVIAAAVALGLASIALRR